MKTNVAATVASPAEIKAKEKKAEVAQNLRKDAVEPTRAGEYAVTLQSLSLSDIYGHAKNLSILAHSIQLEKGKEIKHRLEAIESEMRRRMSIKQS